MATNLVRAPLVQTQQLHPVREVSRGGHLARGRGGRPHLDTNYSWQQHFGTFRK